jgi:hypothetical protein
MPVCFTEYRKLEVVMNVQENTTFVQNFEKNFLVFEQLEREKQTFTETAMLSL